MAIQAQKGLQELLGVAIPIVWQTVSYICASIDIREYLNVELDAPPNILTIVEPL